jgi:predicted nucleic acid-binding protein
VAARDKPRGVIDTCVLVAGIAGFKSWLAAQNESAKLLRDWIDSASFVWLVTEDILAEYKEFLSRLKVRPAVIGAVINCLREEAKFVDVRAEGEVSPDPGDNAFCACADVERAAFIVTLNPRDFPQKKLSAKVILPGDPMPTTGPHPRRRTRT